jgi:hypothetical protein
MFGCFCYRFLISFLYLTSGTFSEASSFSPSMHQASPAIGTTIKGCSVALTLQELSETSSESGTLTAASHGNSRKSLEAIESFFFS